MNDENKPVDAFRKKHGFRSVKSRIAGTSGRGTISDPKTILRAISDSWDALQDGLNDLDEEEKSTMRNFFNGIIPDDNPEIGDLLFETTAD